MLFGINRQGRDLLFEDTVMIIILPCSKDLFACDHFLERRISCTLNARTVVNLPHSIQ